MAGSKVYILYPNDKISYKYKKNNEQILKRGD